MSRPVWLAALVCTACGAPDLGPPVAPGVVADTAATEVPVDGDGDGFPADEDCDDDDAAVHPGAAERCDGLDSDCDGVAEEDGDGDGWLACAECDDDDPDRFPGNDDPIGDRVDQDCDHTDGTGEVLEHGAFGADSYAGLGAALAIRDLDGDGCDELLAGAPGWTTTTPGGEGARPGLFKFDGCGTFDAPSLIRRNGEPTTSSLGWNVDAGQVAGAPVVLVSDFGWGGGKGALYLLPSDYSEWSEPILSVYGNVVESGSSAVLLGGQAEWLLIGSQGSIDHLARYSLFALPATGERDILEADQVVYTDDHDYLTGYKVGDVGDRDGDGILDLGLTSAHVGRSVHFLDVGADAHLDDAPEVWLGGDGPDEGVWVHLSRTGDLTGDGLDDAVVNRLNADGQDPFAGVVAVVPWQGDGVFSLEDDAPAQVLGEYIYDWTGLHSAVADVDGDSQDDLLIGAPGFPEGTSSPGKVMLFLGPLDGRLTRADADRVWVGPAWGDATGWSVAAGDLDGNGRVDLAFGAPIVDDEANDLDDAGTVHLVFNPY